MEDATEGFPVCGWNIWNSAIQPGTVVLNFLNAATLQYSPSCYKL